MTDNPYPPYGPPSEGGHSPGETPQSFPNGPPQQYPPPQYGQAPPYGQQLSGPQQGQPQYGQPQPPPYPQAPPPQYGQQSPYAPYGQQPQFGQYPPRSRPPDGSKNLRPHLRWIAVAWGVAVLLRVAGVVLFVSGLLSSVDNVAPTRTFAAGERSPWPLDPAPEPACSTSPAAPGCATSARSPTGRGSCPSAGTQNLTVNGTQWQQILRIAAPSAGNYPITCTVTEGATARFGVGRDISTAVGGVLGGVALLVAVPGVGVLAAIIVTIVVLVRRSRQRKRLAVRD